MIVVLLGGGHRAKHPIVFNQHPVNHEERAYQAAIEGCKAIGRELNDAVRSVTLPYPKILWERRCYGHILNAETVVTAESVCGPRKFFVRLMMPFIRRKFHQTQQAILKGLKSYVEK